MKVGYARVSTEDQDATLQVDALTKAGCEKIFIEKASGAKKDRVVLAQALNYVRSEDTLVVWKLDRLARSLSHLIEILDRLKEHTVSFMSLTDGIDVSTASGMFFFHMVGAFAEFERAIIRERSMEGLKSARARGRVGGRRPKLSHRQQEKLQTLYDSRKFSVEELCLQFKISRTTFYVYVKTDKEQTKEQKEA